MTAYDLDRLAREIAGLETAESTTSKGRKLQDLVEYLLGISAGVTVIDRNTLNASRSEEKDLWIRHDPRISGLPFVDYALPVECKNEKNSASASEVRDFATKIRDSGGFDGLLVAKAGLAGSAGNSAHEAVSRALSHGIRITVITGTDLIELCTTDDLVMRLQERHTELRLKQTYITI